MRTSITLTLALAAGLAASAALAQQPAPPPGASGPTSGAEAAPPPPPPGGPRPDHPPPPGAHVRLDREPNGVVRVDVHCARQETTSDCAAIASRLLAETSAPQSGK